MIKTFSLTSHGIQQFKEYLNTYKNKTEVFFQTLGLMLHQRTLQTFSLQGARAGHAPWRPFSPGTLRTNAGTWRLRYGTDKNPRRNKAGLAMYRGELMKAGKWAWGQTGPMPGYENQRRYGAESKLLQASGGFKRSFKIQSMDKNHVSYGTMFNSGKTTAEDIIQDREVLFLMEPDYIAIRKQFATFMALSLT